MCLMRPLLYVSTLLAGPVKREYLSARLTRPSDMGNREWETDKEKFTIASSWARMMSPVTTQISSGALMH